MTDTSGSSGHRNKPRGPYVVWVFYGYEGWTFRDADTMEDALQTATNSHGHYWVITPAPVRLGVVGETSPP